MPLLTLKRKGYYYGAFRLLKIEIDLHKAIAIKNAEEKTIDLPVGTHTLIARMDWTKSMPLVIILNENEHKYVLAGCMPFLETCVNAFIPPFIIFTLKEIPKPDYVHD